MRHDTQNFLFVSPSSQQQQQKGEEPKLWMNNPLCIFSDVDKCMSLRQSTYLHATVTPEQRFNRLTQIVIIIYIFTSLMGLQNSWLFLTLSLLFIIILYYIERNIMDCMTRNSNIAKPSNSNQPQTIQRQKGENDTVEYFTSILDHDPQPFCNDSVPLPVLYKYPANSKLSGGPNPKTLEAPPIVPPATDLDVWKMHDLVQHSHINESTPVDLEASGYIPDPDVTKECSIGGKCIDAHMTGCPKDFPHVIANPQLKEAFQYPYAIDLSQDPVQDTVNTACGGYNPENLKYNIPVNSSVYAAQMNKQMSPYNKQVYTNVIQPGVYSQTRVNQPANSNIGISFTQQAPVTKKIVDPHTGGVTYVELTPEEVELDKKNKSSVDFDDEDEYDMNESNVYDPRFTGYGADNRSYIDKMTGQPRYMYDDVNSVRMPNYLVRSKIDMHGFADTYGGLTSENAKGNQNTPDIRTMANKAFEDSVISHREDLQKSMMRKRNAISWQRRVAPIRTSGQYMASGTRRF